MGESCSTSGSHLSDRGEYGPWNPGITPDLSRDLLSRCTIFRSENVFTSLDEAVELQAITGIELSELVTFRPERLVLHELLIRVAADIEVPDPADAPIPSLGINFRQIVRTIANEYVGPKLGEIVSTYEPIRASMSAEVSKHLSVLFEVADGEDDSQAKSPSWWPKLKVRTTAPRPYAEETEWDREIRVTSKWIAELSMVQDPMSKAVYRALLKVVNAFRATHGCVWGDKPLLAKLATNLACNDYASQMIGGAIEPLIATAVETEQFHALPTQPHPIVLSTKGASASGKSTMRPLQRALASGMGVSWSDFALISPDIFRRSLLDFESLGSNYKYAGLFTSQELDIVDHKLDRHMARKAAAGKTPHLLIDRFRFDSFVPDSEEHKQLLARLGDPKLIHFLFMITSPEKTVERAWNRGLKTGRYKPVSDLLGHNVDAYSGMRGFFLARALKPSKIIHYEFLDNDVTAGETPRSIAFGWGGEMNVVDVGGILNIDRFRQINVSARGPEELFSDVSARADFLKNCVREFPVLNFADSATGRIYARTEFGRIQLYNRDAMLLAIDDAAVRDRLTEILSLAFGGNLVDLPLSAEFLEPRRFHTLGRWG